MKSQLHWISGTLAVAFLAAASAAADEHATLVMTSTNAAANEVLVYQLIPGQTQMPLVQTLATEGAGGASGNAGILQFRDGFGAVANYGSNTVSRLVRNDDSIGVGQIIKLAPGCSQPDSVALTQDHLFVVGANCAESHAWPSGHVDGGVVHSIPDVSAAQIVAGESWAAVTLKSGSVLQLALTEEGALTGTSSPVTLPSGANNTPLGAAFWGDILGFDPAHSPDSFALMNKNGQVFPVVGPQPPYPSNAPCWLAKGPGNVWYSGNSPGQAISIFFSDGQGGTFYKSVPLPGVPTDVTVSADGKWLAVIYTTGSAGYVAVFAIDAYGDLSLAATSMTAVASISGVAISQ